MGGEIFCKKEESNQSNLRITYSFCLENVVMMIPKRQLLTLIFACLCFKKEEEEHLEHTSSSLKLRKIVLQNYLIFAHRGFSGPSANPGLEEVFLLIFSLSLTITHATETALTERLEHAKS